CSQCGNSASASTQRSTPRAPRSNGSSGQSAIDPPIENDAYMDLSADLVLTTTRAVRRKIDRTRPVPHDVIRECLDIALQAPTGSNRQNWHFVVVTDAAKRAELGGLYSRAIRGSKQQVSTLTRIEPADRSSYEAQTERVMQSATWMFDHLGEMPGML